MNSLSATEIVLTDAGAPMHYSEITRRILERNLWKTDGKTPAQTVNGRLVTDIKRRGNASRFRREEGRGMFGLNPAPIPEPSNTGTACPEMRGNDKNANAERDSSAKMTLSFANAAEQVLERFAEERPMHYSDITEKALDLGLITTQGKTPKDTMYSQILKEIKRKTQHDAVSRFSKYGKGLVGLSKWTGSGITPLPQGKRVNGSSGADIGTQIAERNKAVKKDLLARLIAMKPDGFEHLIRTLLVHLGFTDVLVTSPSGDGGIDVRATLVVGGVIRTQMAVQAKRWKNNVHSPEIQKVRGSLGSHDKGLVITTSDFSSGAKRESERGNATPVALMNGEQLIDLLVEHSIGIRHSAYGLIELVDPEEAD
jgi:restriction system protein